MSVLVKRISEWHRALAAAQLGGQPGRSIERSAARPGGVRRAVPLPLTPVTSHCQTASICSKLLPRPFRAPLRYLPRLFILSGDGFQSRFRDLDAFPGSCLYSSRFLEESVPVTLFTDLCQVPRQQPLGLSAQHLDISLKHWSTD